jgi:lipoprotein-anchoring transpeptidase ErfK/SrfK
MIGFDGRTMVAALIVAAGAALAGGARAESLDATADATTATSLDRYVPRREVIRAANGIGGGFIETLFEEVGPRERLARLDTPFPALSDVEGNYAPARPVRALPDQRRRDRTAPPVLGGVVAPEFERQRVPYDGRHAAGTIIIDTPNRFLYLVEGGGMALRYGIGVGRPGFEWAGAKTVTRKAEWPDWRPPAAMRKRRPDLPAFMAGGPDNPLGARALYLGSSLYRIHGTNEPSTIGQAVSSGCIRMTNEDVTDLYERVRVGARVIVR